MEACSQGQLIAGVDLKGECPNVAGRRGTLDGLCNAATSHTDCERADSPKTSWDVNSLSKEALVQTLMQWQRAYAMLQDRNAMLESENKRLSEVITAVEEGSSADTRFVARLARQNWRLGTELADRDGAAAERQRPQQATPRDAAAVLLEEQGVSPTATLSGKDGHNTESTADTSPELSAVGQKPFIRPLPLSKLVNMGTGPGCPASDEDIRRPYSTRSSSAGGSSSSSDCSLIPDEDSDGFEVEANTSRGKLSSKGSRRSPPVRGGRPLPDGLPGGPPPWHSKPKVEAEGESYLAEALVAAAGVAVLLLWPVVCSMVRPDEELDL